MEGIANGRGENKWTEWRGGKVGSEVGMEGLS